MGHLDNGEMKVSGPRDYTFLETTLLVYIIKFHRQSRVLVVVLLYVCLLAHHINAMAIES